MNRVQHLQAPVMYWPLVAKLYQDVKAHPEKYPRGMTVRILLGNYPVFSNLNWGSQIMDAISDFRAAGIDKMVDPEIGWKLEFANFPGTYPHSHTKFVVIDGKNVTSAGFNYGYLHPPKDHSSGLGYDLLDLGITMTGPVAQDDAACFSEHVTEDFFNFPMGNHLAANFTEPGETIGHMNESVFVETGDIAGDVPFVLQCLSGLLGLIEIPKHAIGPFHQEESFLSIRKRFAGFLINDFDNDPGQRVTDGPRFETYLPRLNMMHVRDIDGDHRSHFRATVSLQQIDSIFSLERVSEGGA